MADAQQGGHRLIGRDFTPPDVEAKVTGRARYAEDFRADGMLFCRLWTSPMPHGRVRSIDASAALAMDGVMRAARIARGPLAGDGGGGPRTPSGTISGEPPSPTTRASRSWPWRRWTRPRPRTPWSGSGSTWIRSPSAWTPWRASAPAAPPPGPTGTPWARRAPWSSAGPRRSSGRPERGGSRWASPSTSGPTATWRRPSPTRPWSWTSPSSPPARPTTPWSPAPPWRSGGTAPATSTARARARASWCRGWPATSGSIPRTWSSWPSTAAVASDRRPAPTRRCRSRPTCPGRSDGRS